VIRLPKRAVILAGGLGTRLAEETETRPKPMVEIAGRPILWHILKHYSSFGIKEFFIALGYKGDVIKRYFMEYAHVGSNVTIDTAIGRIDTHGGPVEDWTVHLIDTAVETQTGGRLKRLREYLRDEPFFLTYGDGVCNVDLVALAAFHRSHGRVGTVTAVRPPARFGGLSLNEDTVTSFNEKRQIDVGWINGGFFVFEPRIFCYLDGDRTSLEADALTRLAEDGELKAFRHEGFWQCMDTLREKRLLDALWQQGSAPWKVWHD
jgi:glucose-1-phosphate cytidylyltransferase